MDQQKSSSAEKRVCVTGAGGYVASWLVKLLLSHNYTVIGAVRNPDDEKYGDLKKLDEENLELVKADLLDYPSLSAAINGCHGVFHVASPVPLSSVPDPEVELVAPAVKGTENVLRACSEAGVKRVVMVSSAAAVMLNPSWPEDVPQDESCWSDPDHCKATNNWYCYSKTVAETEALAYAKRTGLNLVTLIPCLVWGPVLLRQAPNASTVALLKLIKEGYEEIEERHREVVDVRDVAEGLLMVYETAEAEGRYICSSHLFSTSELVQILKKHYPTLNHPKRVIGEIKEKKNGLTSDKLQKLGWRFRPLEDTVVDSVESYKQLGLLSAD